MANQDSGFLELNGQLDTTVSAYMVGEIFTSMQGACGVSISVQNSVNSNKIIVTGSTEIDVVAQNLINSYATMYGFLNANIVVYSAIKCSDLPIDFVIQEIESTGCSIGDSVELRRYRGDTYPVSTTLSKNGNKNLTGLTFKMSTQINNGTIYTVDGVITDSAIGEVSFPLSVDAVDVAGAGEYDIQGEDGSYIYTYEKGVFTLLDDLTV